MKKYIISNWKMNKSLADVAPYVKFLKKNAKDLENFAVCVPSVMLTEFARLSKGVVEVGAENCHYAKKGAYTGEISAEMVKEAGASYVIIGHSERRKYFDESCEFIAEKAKSALSAGLKTILCVGESLDERSKFKSVIKKQVLDSLKGVEDFKNLIIAYEPVWAIGTGVVATSADIIKAHSYIKEIIAAKFGVKVPVLYGGSVNSKNSADILALGEVDGVLVGGASLDPAEIIKIAESRG